MTEAVDPIEDIILLMPCFTVTVDENRAPWKVIVMVDYKGQINHGLMAFALRKLKLWIFIVRIVYIILVHVPAALSQQ